MKQSNSNKLIPSKNQTISETVSRSRQSKKGTLGGQAATVGAGANQNSNTANAENQQNTSTDNLESDSFSKHYNKELRVSKDEIPIVLGELNDSAIQFIKKEQYDKSLNLLQKAYGIIDVIDFTLCRRDKLQLFVLFHNMALCYQKMQMLDECAQCIEQTFENIPMDLLNIEDRSISNRMRKISIICKLKMQYCAILSQIHRHKDALEQARESVRLGHLLINDLRQLCSFYVQREEIQNNGNNIFSQFDTNNSINQNVNNSVSSVNKKGKNINAKASVEYDQNQLQNQRRQLISSRNRSFSHFLSQQEASTSNYDSFYGGNNENIFANNHNGSIRLNSNNLNNPLDRSKIRKNGANSNHSLSSFYSVNQLEESMSFVERTARKLLPILFELKKKMIPEKKIAKSAGNNGSTDMTSHHVKNGSEENIQEDSGNQQANQYLNNDSDNEVLLDLSKHVKNISKAQSDMKNILGYLNQGEWTQTLSIGSIMQLAPIKLRDLLEEGKNEMELSRDSFIQKVSHLAVSYFCFSTEIRFILQMKEDPTFEPEIKQKESEYWHAKSLEISCTFLPGECPLLNHINLSYNKHFAPVKTTIMEDETVEQDLIVVKPLNGIENQKVHPIIKNVDDLGIAITPYQITPLNAVTNQFLSQMMQFNEYAEQQNNQSNIHKSVNKFMNNSSIQITNQHNSSQHNAHGVNKNSSMTMSGGDNKLPGDNLNETYNTQINNHKQKGSDISQAANSTSKMSDMEKFEKLFKKLMENKQIDKNSLIERLQNMDGGKGQGNIRQQNSNNLNILQEANMTDFLMDENILADENIEDDTAANIATEKVNQLNNPLNSQYKFQNNKNKLNSLQQQSSIHDQPHHLAASNARPKTTGKVIGSSSNNHHGSSKSRKVNDQIMNTHKQESISTHDSQLTNKQSINSRMTSNTTKSGKAFASGMQQNQVLVGNHDHMPSTASNINKHAQILHQQQHTQSMNDKTKNKQRPLSSGIQKMMKAENNRSRIGQVNQNLSMYDNLGNGQQKMPHHHGQSQGMISNGMKKSSPDKQGSSENQNVQNGRKPHESMIYQQQNSSSYQQIPSNSHGNQNYAPSSIMQQNSQYSNQTKSSSGIQQRQSSHQPNSGSSQQVISKQNYLNQVIQSSKQGNNYASNQGAQSNSQGVNQTNNVQAYDELKRRLLTEYKKLVTNKKSFDDNLHPSDQRVSNMMSSQAQVHGQSNKVSTKIKSNVMVGSSGAGVGGSTNQGTSAGNAVNSQITTSTGQKKGQQHSMSQNQLDQQLQQTSQSQQMQGNSPKHHLNVYKPTFIINNSFQNDSGQQSASLSNTGQQNVIHIDQQQHINEGAGNRENTANSQGQASTNKKFYRQQQQQQMQQKAQQSQGQQQNFNQVSSTSGVGQTQSSQGRKKVNLGSQSNIQGDLNSLIQDNQHQNQILQSHLGQHHGLVQDPTSQQVVKQKQMIGQSSTSGMIGSSGKLTSSKANALKVQSSQLTGHHQSNPSHHMNQQYNMINSGAGRSQQDLNSGVMDRQTNAFIQHMAGNQSQQQLNQQTSGSMLTQGTGLKTTGSGMQKTSAHSGKRQTQGSSSSNMNVVSSHHHHVSSSNMNVQNMVGNHHMHQASGQSMLNSNKMATYEKLKKKLSYSQSNNQGKK